MFRINCCAAILIFIASLIRLVYAINAPLIGDEKEFMAVADTISFNIHQINLPVEHDLINHPLLSVYILKLAKTLFPLMPLGIRVSSLVASLFTLILLYIFCRVTLGEKQAIVALILLGLNRFHVGVSGAGVDNALLLFLSFFSIFLFWKALTVQKSAYFIASGAVLGLAYLTNESAILLLGCFMIYFLFDNSYGWRRMIKNKDVYLLWLSFLCVVLVDIVWIFKYGPSQRLLCGGFFSNLGIGSSGVGFFIADILKYINHADYNSLVSWEYPAMTWGEGLLLFLCSLMIVVGRKLKTKALKITGIIFLSYLFIISMFKNAEIRWMEISLVPAIYLSSNIIVEGMAKNVALRFVFYIFIVFSFVSVCLFSSSAKYTMPPHRFAAMVDYDTDLMKWYFSQGQIDKAMEEARDALVVCPHEARIHNLLGVFYTAKGKVSAAESEFVRALALRPDLLYARVNLTLLRKRCIRCIGDFFKTYCDN